MKQPSQSQSALRAAWGEVATHVKDYYKPYCCPISGDTLLKSVFDLRDALWPEEHSASVYHSPSRTEGHYQEATFDIAHYAAHLGWTECDIQKAMEVVAGDAWDEPVFLGHPDSGGLVTKAHSEVEELGWRRLDIILAFGLVAAHKAGLIAWR